MIIRKVFNRIKTAFFLSSHEKMVRRYFRHGGEKLRYDYRLNENSVVFDLGGYHGDWANGISSRYHCRIFVFEPVTEFAEGIIKRFDGNKMIEIYQFGLGGASITREIRVAGDGSSMFRNAGKAQNIKTVDASEWIRDRNYNSIDLMKINIEGAEYELLENLIQGDMVKRISNIQVQFHDVIPDASKRMAAIQDALSKSHFLTYQYRFVWENWEKKQGVA